MLDSKPLVTIVGNDFVFPMCMDIGYLSSEQENKSLQYVYNINTYNVHAMLT